MSFSLDHTRTEPAAASREKVSSDVTVGDERAGCCSRPCRPSLPDACRERGPVELTPGGP